MDDNASAWRTEPAAEALAEAARERRVVMINEAHHVARTRLVTLLLLEPMRESGFTHLALEGLDPDDTAINDRGHAVTESGFYLGEPVFGEMVREAVRLGYEIVAYEHKPGDQTGLDMAERQRRRETGQARNLAAIFDDDPDARVVVHAGYAHIYRNHEINRAPTMIAEFERMTGIDVLAVDQNYTRESADPARPGATYRAVVRALGAEPGQPSVLRTPGGTLWSAVPEKFNVSVLLPAPEKPGRRAGWLSLGGLRTLQSMDGAICRQEFPCLIEARYKGESGDAVPADRHLLESPGPVRLWLRPGEYRLRAVTGAGPGPASTVKVEGDAQHR